MCRSDACVQGCWYVISKCNTAGESGRVGRTLLSDAFDSCIGLCEGASRITRISMLRFAARRAGTLLADGIQCWLSGFSRMSPTPDDLTTVKDDMLAFIEGHG